MKQTDLSANTLLHNSLCYWRKSSDSWKESIGWPLPKSFQHTEYCLNVKHHESNDILHLFLMKHNLKSSSKGIWSLLNSFIRGQKILSLNPTTFLEISWPFSDSEALSWGIGAGLGRGISSGGSGRVAEGSQGKLELGWDWNKQVSGLGNQCEGCWVVSSGSVTFVRGDLSNRLGQGEEKARTVWSMDFWPSFKMGRRGATAKTGDGSSIQSCSPRVTAGISRQNILSSSAALSPGQPLHTLAVVIFFKPKPLCH